MDTERVLAEVTLSGAPLEAYRNGLPLAHCMESPDVRYRVFPARPGNEVLADAVRLCDSEAEALDELRPPWKRTAQETRDLAAELRALAAGPTADDYEAALDEESMLITGEDWMAMMQAATAAEIVMDFIRTRARELAAERGHRQRDSDGSVASESPENALGGQNSLATGVCSVCGDEPPECERTECGMCGEAVCDEHQSDGICFSCQ